MPGTGREGRRARGPGLHAGKRGRRISYTGRARSTAGRRARAPRRGKVRQANQLYRPGREGDAREIVGTYCLCTRPASGRRGREGRGSAALRRASEPCARVLRSATQTLQRGSPPRGSPATARARTVRPEKLLHLPLVSFHLPRRVHGPGAAEAGALPGCARHHVVATRSSRSRLPTATLRAHS
jgi:hypothetical protein